MATCVMQFSSVFPSLKPDTPHRSLRRISGYRPFYQTYDLCFYGTHCLLKEIPTFELQRSLWHHSNMSGKKVCVIGAGVIGLSSAVCIQSEIPGVHVTIIADAFSPNTTGDGSAGFWEPHLINSGQTNDVINWGKITFEYMLDLWKSEYAEELGVVLVSGYNFISNCDHSSYQDQVFGFRQLTDNEYLAIHPDKRPGVTYTSLAIDVKSYLPWLMNKFQRNGGMVIKKRVSSLEELNGAYDVIVNCTGLGSYQLLNDRNLRPVRGQTIRVHAPWVKHFYIDDDPADSSNQVYILPGARDVILGGTSQSGNWSTEVDATDRKNIFDGCCQLVPSLRKAKLSHDWVGLRPQRSEIRVELESKTPSKTMIVHNYGHSGSGVTLHWGCAQKTSKLVQEALQLHQCSKL